MTVIPYERTPNPEIATQTAEDGTPILQSYHDRCPVCEADVLWWRDADEWLLNDDGSIQETMWGSWFCDCDACGNECTMPYEDGTAQVLWEPEDD